MKLKQTLYSLGLVVAGVVMLVAVAPRVSADTNNITFQDEVDVKFTFNEMLSMELSSNELTIDELVPGNAAHSNTITVGVTTNNVTGYTLSAKVGGTGQTVADSTLKNTSANTTFASIASRLQLASFSDNNWGYTTDTTVSSSSHYYGLLYDSDTTINKTTNFGGTAASECPVGSENACPGTNSTSFTIGAKASETQAAGEYTNVITFTAVSNYAPKTIMDLAYMQDFSGLESAQVAEVKASMAVGTSYRLKDSRDGKTYDVVKLADGNVWMQENLALDLTNESIVNKLSASNTNATANSLTSLKSGNRNSGDNYATAGLTYSEWTSGTSGSSYTTPLVKTTSKDSTIASASLTGEDTWKYGVYYNYCAASAGSYCYDSGSGTDNATGDICPAGWKMPAGGSSGDYSNLYNGDYGYNTPALYRAALHLPLSGFVGSGSVYDQGSYGRWWSSTRNSGNGLYSLYVITSYVNPSGKVDRSHGLAVRCTVSK